MTTHNTNTHEIHKHMGYSQYDVLCVVSVWRIVWHGVLSVWRHTIQIHSTLSMTYWVWHTVSTLSVWHTVLTHNTNTHHVSNTHGIHKLLSVWRHRHLLCLIDIYDDTQYKHTSCIPCASRVLTSPHAYQRVLSQRHYPYTHVTTDESCHTMNAACHTYQRVLLQQQYQHTHDLPGT